MLMLQWNHSWWNLEIFESFIIPLLMKLCKNFGNCWELHNSSVLIWISESYWKFSDDWRFLLNFFFNFLVEFTINLVLLLFRLFFNYLLCCGKLFSVVVLVLWGTIKPIVVFRKIMSCLIIETRMQTLSEVDFPLSYIF